MPKHLLILERNYQGHRLTGVRVLIDALLDLNATHPVFDSITLATTKAGFESAEFSEQLLDVSGQFKQLVLDDQHGKVTTLSAAWVKVQDWRKHVCSGQFDHVFIPYADGLLQMLAFLKFVPGFVKPPKHVCVEGILMRGSFGYEQARQHTKNITLFGLKHAPFNRVHLIDPLPYSFIKQNKPHWLHKISLLPDPITPTQALDKTPSRLALNLDEDCHWIGCIGIIDDRKGADKLVRAFNATNFPNNTKLLLAGKHSPELVNLISTINNPRIVSINRYLSELELNQALGALDLVATPYPNFIGSASIVLRAAAGERYCLGANAGWMKLVIPVFGLGDICNINNEPEFSATLEGALTQAVHYQPSTLCREFVEYGSLENVYAHWTDLLRLRSGLSANNNMKPWPTQTPMESSIGTH